MLYRQALQDKYKAAPEVLISRRYKNTVISPGWCTEDIFLLLLEQERNKVQAM